MSSIVVSDGFLTFRPSGNQGSDPVALSVAQLLQHRIRSGRLLGGDNSSTWLSGYDLRRRKRMGVLIPELGTNSWAALSSDGHFAGSADAKDHLVVVAMHRDGRLLTMTLEEFQTQFKWVNDPEKVRFLE